MWQQCAIEWGFEEYSLVKLKKVIDLKPTGQELEPKLIGFGKDLFGDKEIPQRFQASLQAIGSYEVLGEKIRAAVPTGDRRTIPIVLVPSVSELVFGETSPLGITLPERIKRAFLKAQVDRPHVRPPHNVSERNPEFYEGIALVLYGHDSVEQMVEDRNKGLGTENAQVHGKSIGVDYYSVLAHELGHILQLGHDGEFGETLMAGESNYIPADQCGLARQRAKSLNKLLSDK